MPGQFTNTGTNPGGKLTLTNTNNSGNLIITSLAPVLYLDAGNLASYAGSGTVWYDLSGNGNNVTMQNSGDISFSSGNGGYFSTGNTGYFYNASSTTGIPTGNIPYSINSWVQFPTGWPGGSNYHTILTIGDQPTYNQLNTFSATFSGYLTVNWFNQPSDPPALETSTWTPSSPGTNWMNVVSQWDGATRSIWYNGVQQASDSIGTYLGNNTNILIGIDFPGFGNYLIGNIGLLQVYDTALTSTQITANFNAQKTRFGL